MREDSPSGSLPPGNLFPIGEEGNSGDSRPSWPIMARLMASSQLQCKYHYSNGVLVCTVCL